MSPSDIESREGLLRMGWASSNITPDKPVQLHGQLHERVSTSVHDPCTATVLAIEAATDAEPGEQAILVSCDLVSIDGGVLQQLRARVGELLPEIDPRKLLVNVTHTHTGPTMVEGLYPPPPDGVITPSEYATFFVERVAQTVVQAWQRRAPAGVSRALGHAVLGFNRRVVYADGTAKMYGSSDSDAFAGIEGGMDPGLELLFTWSEDNTLTGVAVNIACPSQVVEGQHFISADFWHPFREEIRRRLGEHVFVYPMCSAAGDQSPRDLVRRNRGEPDMRQIEGMNELGRRLALAVEDAFHHAQGPVEWRPLFQHHVEDLSLPMRKATAQEAEIARQTLEELTRDGAPDPRSRDGRLVQRQRKVLERFETQGEDPRYVANLHVLRLGDVAIATNPFELFLDFGLQIKARSKAEQTFLVQLTNDRGIYLPTAKAVAGGSYSAMIYDNLVGPEGGQLLVERQVEAINDLWAAAVL